MKTDQKIRGVVGVTIVGDREGAGATDHQGDRRPGSAHRADCRALPHNPRAVLSPEGLCRLDQDVGNPRVPAHQGHEGRSSLAALGSRCLVAVAFLTFLAGCGSKFIAHDEAVGGSAPTELYETGGSSGGLHTVKTLGGSAGEVEEPHFDAGGSAGETAAEGGASPTSGSAGSQPSAAGSSPGGSGGSGGSMGGAPSSAGAGGLPQVATGGSSGSSSGGAAQGGSSGAPQGGSAGAPPKTYADYDTCSCDPSVGKFMCKDNGTNQSYVFVDPAPTCTCVPRLSCTDLRYGYPQGVWLVIECLGTSTKGTPSIQLWYQASGNPQPYKQNTLECGRTIHIEKEGNYFMLFFEGTTQLADYEVPPGPGPKILKVPLE